MTALVPFGARLARLLEIRGMSAATLAAGATVPMPRLDSVLTGAEPSSLLLRRLAPALNLHTADLFLIAPRRVPDDSSVISVQSVWSPRMTAATLVPQGAGKNGNP